jgi:nicotinamidase-related amidase
MVSQLKSLANGRKTNDKLVYAHMIRKPGDPYFAMEPDYCFVGSPDVAFMDLPKGDRQFQVHRPDITALTSFRTFLMSTQVDTIHLIGMETHRSVLLTAISLRGMDYRVCVHAGITASRALYFQETALSLMAAAAGIEVL